MANTNVGILPVGYRFQPSDAELVRHYLLKKVLGLRLGTSFVQECDLYGDKEPWEIWDEFSAFVTDYVAENDVERREKCLYFFTRLKKMSPTGKRFDRTVGSGTWHGETKVSPVGSFGSKKMFTYGRRKKKENTNGDGVKKNEFHWRMHEFSLDAHSFGAHLDQIHNTDYVVCRIIRDKKVKVEEEQQPEPICKRRRTSSESDQQLLQLENHRFRFAITPPAMQLQIPATNISSLQYQSELQMRCGNFGQGVSETTPQQLPWHEASLSDAELQNIEQIEPHESDSYSEFLLGK